MIKNIFNYSAHIGLPEKYISITIRKEPESNINLAFEFKCIKY